MQAVSKDYLAKVMQTLSGIGVVRAHPGVGGGYRLARSPFDISIAEVVRPFESAERVFSCLHERRHCEAYPRCVINELMEASVARFYEELESCSFGDLLEKGISDGLKPSWLEAELSREKVRAAGQ
jgi:Rrf2 family nitric oxide-sensitive transcriptional repressor